MKKHRLNNDYTNRRRVYDPMGFYRNVSKNRRTFSYLRRTNASENSRRFIRQFSPSPPHRNRVERVIDRAAACVRACDARCVRAPPPPPPSSLSRIAFTSRPFCACVISLSVVTYVSPRVRVARLFCLVSVNVCVCVVCRVSRLTSSFKIFFLFLFFFFFFDPPFKYYNLI